MGGQVKRLNTGSSSKRFRYAGFTERIKAIDLKYSTKISRASLEDAEAGSHFFETLDRWRDLNCTAHFGAFFSDVRPYLGDLTNVVLFKDSIAATLAKHLSVPNSLACEPLLNLMIALVQDLRSHVFEYYGTLFDAAASQLCQDDPDVIECVFNALLFLSRYYSKELLADRSILIGHWVGLLSAFPRPYVSEFSAECLALIVRKTDNCDCFEPILSDVISLAEREKLSVYFVEQLLGKIFIVEGRFKPVSQNITACALHALVSIKKEGLRRSLYLSLANAVSSSLKSKQPSAIFEPILESFNSGARDADTAKIILDALFIIQKRVGRDIDPSSHECLISACKGAMAHRDLQIDDFVTKIVTEMIHGGYCPSETKEFLDLIRHDRASIYLQIAQNTIGSAIIHFEIFFCQDLIKNFVTFREHRGQLLTLLQSISQSKTSFPFGKFTVPILSLCNWDSCEDINLLHALCPNLEAESTMMCLKKRLDESLDRNSSIDRFAALLRLDLLLNKSVDTAMRPKVFAAVLSNIENTGMVNAAAEYFVHSRLSPSEFDKIYSSCRLNFVSDDIGLKRATLSLLYCAEKLPDSLNKALPAIKNALELAPAVDTYRNILIQHLTLESLFKKKEMGECSDLAVCFLYGQLKINLSILWGETIRLLSVFCEDYPSIWSLCHKDFESESMHKRVVLLLSAIPSAVQNNSEFLDMYIKAHRKHVIGYLQVLSKIKFGKDELGVAARQRTLEFLSYPDQIVQQEALNCLNSQKEKGVPKYYSNFCGVVQDKNTKDELVAISSQLLDPSTDPIERKRSVPMLMRILFGRLLSPKHKKSSSQGPLVRRKMIIQHLAKYPAGDISFFVSLLLSSVRNDPNTSKLVGFLHILQPIIYNLFFYLTDEDVNSLLIVLKDCLERSSKEKDTIAEGPTLDDNEIEDIVHSDGSLQLKQMRYLAMKRTKELLECLSHSETIVSFVKNIYSTVLGPRFGSLSSEFSSNASSLLDIVHIWATDQRQLYLFMFSENEQILQSLAELTNVDGVSTAVLLKAWNILECIAENPKLSHLLDGSIDGLFNSARRVLSDRNMEPALFQAITKVLASLSDRITDPLPCSRLVDVFVPLLGKKERIVGAAVKENLLRFISRYFVLTASLSNTRLPERDVYVTVSSLLADTGDKAVVQAVHQVLNAFGAYDPSFVPVSELVRSLCSFSSESVSETDFNARQKSFMHIDEFASNISAGHDCAPYGTFILPILSGLFHNIFHTDDYSMQSGAASCLCKLISLKGPALLSDDNIYSYVVDKSCTGLESRTETTRTQFLRVVYTLSITFNARQPFIEFSSFSVELEESNFFLNAQHIQIHRRIRALNRLIEFLKTTKLSENVLRRFFLPITGHPIFECSKKTESDFVYSAIKAYGVICGQFGWSQYYRSVRHLLKLIEKKPDLEKYLIRTVTEVLLNFGFDLAGDALERCKKGLLSDVYRHLFSRDAKKQLRPQLAVGIVRIISRMGTTEFQGQLPRLLVNLCQALKDKDVNNRDAARDALKQVCAISGPDYFLFVLKELRTALSRGYHAHILGYTLHSLLHSSFDGKYDVGCLDDLLPDMLAIVREEIFGKMSEEKEAKEFTGKSKEVKAEKSFDTLEILARNVSTLKQSEMVGWIYEILSNHFSERIKSKARDCLERILLGAMKNPKLNVEHLLIVIHAVLSGQKALDYALEGPDLTPSEPVNRSYFAHNKHILDLFGLKLLHELLKTNAFENSIQILSMIDPFCCLVEGLVRSEHSALSALAIKVIARLNTMALPSIKASLLRLQPLLFDNALNSSKTSSEIFLSVLRLLAQLMVGNDAKIEAVLIQRLCKRIVEDFSALSEHGALYQVLRAIIGRQIVCEQVVALIAPIQHALVTSHSNSVREQCRAVYIKFLFDFPLGKQKLGEHMSFVMQNLSYGHPIGRLSILDTLKCILQKMPAQILGEYALALFIAVAQQFANEDDGECKQSLVSIIKVLYLVEPHNQKIQMRDLILKWVEKANTQKLSLSLAAIYIEAKGAFDAFLDLLHRVYRVLPRPSEQKSAADGQNGADPETAYLVLNCLCKIAAVSVTAIDGFENLEEFLTLNHEWVRQAATKVILALCKGSYRELSAQKAFSGCIIQSLDLGEHSTAEYKSLICDLMSELLVAARNSKDACADEEPSSSETEKACPGSGTGREKKSGVELMLKRVYSLCKRLTDERQSLVSFGVFSRLVSAFRDIDVFGFYAMKMCLRVEAESIRSAPLQQAAQTLMEGLQREYKDDLYKLHDKVGRHMGANRMEKRKRSAIMAAAKPERAAQEKIRKNLKKRLAKRRRTA